MNSSGKKCHPTPAPDTGGCEERDVSGMSLFQQSPTGAGYDLEEPPPT